MPVSVSDSSFPATVSAARELIATRKISPEELITQHLINIERLNPRLNAIVTLDAERALLQARKQSNGIALGHKFGPLTGVPFTVKDSIATAGMRTTYGSAVFTNHIPERDAPAVARLREAGAILLGKTNCPEFAFGIHTWSPLFGHTRSPIDELSPGGSSGGEAAAISAGLSLFGLGTDFGGSLRWPAASTGLVGLRPTPGRVPTTGQYPPVLTDRVGLASPLSLQGRLQVIGPVALTAPDALMVSLVIAGEDASDSASVPVPFGNVRHFEAGKLRLGWSDGGNELPVARNVAEQLYGVLGQLSDAGADCERIAVSIIADCALVYNQLRGAEMHLQLKSAVEDREYLLSEPIRQLLAESPSQMPEFVPKLWERRESLRTQFLAATERFHAVLLPVAAEAALPMPQGEEYDKSQSWDLLGLSRAVTLLGLPVATAPIGCDSTGRPIGIQVIGPPFREDLVLAIVNIIEFLGRGSGT